MSKRNFYEVLGVEKSASADDIRKAYRKLARQYHPDVNKAKDAATKFNEVQEAYDVLSDEQKRKAYDRLGDRYAEGGRAQPEGGPHYTWTNVGGPGGGDVDFDMEDLGSMFETLFGGQRSGGPFAGQARPRGGARARAAPSEVHHQVEITFHTAAVGGTERLKLSHNGKARTVEVNIPPGVNPGAQLRMRGAGPDGSDLILTIKVGEHPLFRRGDGAESGRGLDLYLDLPLTIAEATLGTKVSVPTLTDAVELTIPPGTASGRKLRLRGRGIKDGEGRHGDLYAVIKIVPPDPEHLTNHERDLLEQISAKGPKVRAGHGWPGSH
ncbi:MAG: DnaJ domain-containing protein [Phycisphaerales bacterium]|nr:DnaJ domain-containing protein [Phycisphaerales bacterium]